MFSRSYGGSQDLYGADDEDHVTYEVEQDGDNLYYRGGGSLSASSSDTDGHFGSRSRADASRSRGALQWLVGGAFASVGSARDKKSASQSPGILDGVDLAVPHHSAEDEFMQNGAGDHDGDVNMDGAAEAPVQQAVAAANDTDQHVPYGRAPAASQAREAASVGAVARVPIPLAGPGSQRPAAGPVAGPRPPDRALQGPGQPAGRPLHAPAQAGLKPSAGAPKAGSQVQPRPAAAAPVRPAVAQWPPATAGGQRPGSSAMRPPPPPMKRAVSAPAPVPQHLDMADTADVLALFDDDDDGPSRGRGRGQGQRGKHGAAAPRAATGEARARSGSSTNRTAGTKRTAGGAPVPAKPLPFDTGKAGQDPFAWMSQPARPGTTHSGPPTTGPRRAFNAVTVPRPGHAPPAGPSGADNNDHGVGNIDADDDVDDSEEPLEAGAGQAGGQETDEDRELEDLPANLRAAARANRAAGGTMAPQGRSLAWSGAGSSMRPPGNHGGQDEDDDMGGAAATIAHGGSGGAVYSAAGSPGPRADRKAQAGEKAQAVLAGRVAGAKVGTGSSVGAGASSSMKAPTMGNAGTGAAAEEGSTSNQPQPEASVPLLGMLVSMMAREAGRANGIKAALSSSSSSSMPAAAGAAPSMRPVLELTVHRVMAWLDQDLDGKGVFEGTVVRVQRGGVKGRGSMVPTQATASTQGPSTGATSSLLIPPPVDESQFDPNTMLTPGQRVVITVSDEQLRHLTRHTVAGMVQALSSGHEAGQTLHVSLYGHYSVYVADMRQLGKAARQGAAVPAHAWHNPSGLWSGAGHAGAGASSSGSNASPQDGDRWRPWIMMPVAMKVHLAEPAGHAPPGGSHGASGTMHM